VRYVLSRRISYLIEKGDALVVACLFIDVGNILLNLFFVFLIKSEMCVVAGASPFFHMRDARYRERVSFQLANAWFRSLVSPHLLVVMLTSLISDSLCSTRCFLRRATG
jgi:hypothetical protein